MKVADYQGQSNPTFHRVASLVALLVLGSGVWFGFLFGGVRMIAVQVVSTGLIWFADGEIYDPLFKRHVSFRTLGWLTLVGLPLFITAAFLIFPLIFN
jgi:hypothetical protein